VTRVYAAQDGAAVLYANATIKSSDMRLKDFIKPVNLGLQFINKLNPVSYLKISKSQYKGEEENNETRYEFGLIAQEVDKILKQSDPESTIVSEDNEGFLGMDYKQIIMPLIKSIQELSIEIEKLKKDEDLETAEKRVMRLVAERERIGAVNLLAEDEYTKLREKVNDTIKDKNEIQESIEKLHDAINKINKEGVSRLRDAFQIVNENFERLFTKLFGGGKAYLKLVQNDEDPLNSGLEIFASPPGKKMQNITLLSGGEQALTAISLLFAVFIANPSPFCILDEVDAPLDDNNVDRFCSMVEEISQKVQTKFIIITHNRMTMSRVDRLYGVTMPEEGVSQIVSVELEEAIQYAE